MKNLLIDPEHVELYRSQSNTKYLILIVAIVTAVVGLVWLGNMGEKAQAFMDVYIDEIR